MILIGTTSVAILTAAVARGTTRNPTTTCGAHRATTSSTTTNFTNSTTSASTANRTRFGATGTAASTAYRAALTRAAERAIIAAKRYSTTGRKLGAAEPFSQILREVALNQNIPDPRTVVVTANCF